MLTPTKKKVLDFINSYTRKNSLSPSLQEICKGLRLRSVSTIHQHIKELENAGYLNKSKNKPRGIGLIKNNHNKKILLMGLIAAGGPIEAIRDPKPIDVPQNMLSSGANYYALKIVGTSMIEDGIFDGDVIVVREQSNVDDGEKAVVYLPDKNAVTLKRIYRDKNRIKLVPANKFMKPFYATNIEIQGKVVGIIRQEV